ncbi:MAG: type II toxin-antitoxin system VapC family toxin [Desulfuromonadales bacterium]|nr:type II toxin-antitoxin system VapC family toxin [Desulfuromonadales bacterium]
MISEGVSVLDFLLTKGTNVHMRIVADTNIFLAAALNETEKSIIIELTTGHDLLAPQVLSFEIGNALSAMVKRGRLTVAQGLAALDEIGKVPVELVTIDLRCALQLACRHNIYAYDAYFLECAQAYRAPLLTLDASMRTVAKKLGISLLEIRR